MDEHDTLRVLVADDEESFLGVLTTVLESAHRFVVHSCEDGEEAIEALKGGEFDVVIVDHKMPGMTGLNVLQWMHEQKMTAPVIVLTAAGTENIAVEAMKLGAYDYIRKDHFDREHFPIVVRGVHERYLFKKEKERSEHSTTERQRIQASIELLRNSLASFAHSTDTSLARIDALMEKSTTMLESFLLPDGTKNLEHHFALIKKEHEAIATISKSMVRLLRTIYDTYMQSQTDQEEVRSSSSSKETTKNKRAPVR